MKRPVCALVAVLLAVVACRDDLTQASCGRIPDNGCPTPVVAACKDPTCAAVYACTSGQWDKIATCAPLPDAGTPDAATPSPRDASFDAPVDKGNCPTALVLPDCSLTTAQACGANCCGCEDIFVCDNGGWEAWGICGPSGPEPR